MKICKKYIALAALVLLTFTQIKAQVPGYLGKRFLVSANITPAISFPFDELGGGESSVRFGVVPRYGAGIEYVINRRRTISFRYAFTQSKLRIYNPYDIDDIDPYYYGKALQHRISLRTGRSFSGNLPAPLGVYAGWDLSLTFGQLRQKNVFGSSGYKRIIPSVFSYMGYRRAIGKRIMAGAMFEFNWFYIGYIYSGVFSGGYDYSNPGSSFPKQLLKSYYYNSNLVNITFEFTFLPF